MEINRNILSLNPECKKPYLREKDSVLVSTRKRLLEKALVNDKAPTRNRSAAVRSTEKVSQPASKPAPKPIHSRASSNKRSNDAPKTQVEPEKLRSKSPACTNRNSSLDLTKKAVNSKFVRGKSVERFSGTQRVGKPEKPTDCIGKIANQFSIAKELKDLSLKGNEDLGRTLIMLLTHIDYHIKETQAYPTEVFIEYLSSPGIVVQGLKKLQGAISNDKITDSNHYTETLAAAYDLYSKIESVSSTSGHILLASLLDSIFKCKNFPSKSLKFIKIADLEKAKAQEKLNRSLVEPVKPSIKRTHTKAESLSVPLKIPSNKDTSYIDLHLEQVESDGLYMHETESIEKCESFYDSKKFLLEKFFTKMLHPEAKAEEKAERSPLKDILQNSFERRGAEEPKSGIRAKSAARPSSATPQLGKTKVEKKTIETKPSIETKIVTDSKFSTENKPRQQEIKRKQEDSKLKSILLGSRFYKKLDEKFVELLVEIMSKDSKELKRLKQVNFEEYTKSKNDLITANKDLWAKEALKSLQNAEFINGNSENEMLAEMKQEAMFEYLHQEKILPILISKAEALELSSRKL